MPKASSVRNETIYNNRGIIADNYHELQGIHVLEKARESHSLPRASVLSTLQALFQCVEVAILNLTDLFSRTEESIKKGDVNSALTKLSWARGFHRTLVQLSLLPMQLHIYESTSYNQTTYLKISDSSSYHDYIRAIKAFDKSMLDTITEDEVTFRTVISSQSLESPRYMLIHLTRICNHESTVWERNLACVATPMVINSYKDFVASDIIHNAVYDRVLSGDTYFMQFRGLHQIPEILSREINDRIEAAILSIRSSNLKGAYEHLRTVNILTEGILATLPVIIDNLSTSDYHIIRENLGLTSGSHSVNLHYHLFRDLYNQLGEELNRKILTIEKTDDINLAIHQVESRKSEEDISFHIHLLLNECLALQSFVHTWRDIHLQLPRNNLGGNYTKSLTGSSDAVFAVKKMRETARDKDIMAQFSKARNYKPLNETTIKLSLASYFETEDSLDKLILEITGEATKDGFKDVQERLGAFADNPSFIPPSKRRV